MLSHRYRFIHPSYTRRPPSLTKPPQPTTPRAHPYVWKAHSHAQLPDRYLGFASSLMSRSPFLVLISSHTSGILTSSTSLGSSAFSMDTNCPYLILFSVPYSHSSCFNRLTDQTQHFSTQRDTWITSLGPSPPSHFGPSQDCYKGFRARAYRPPFLQPLVLTFHTPLRFH